MTRQRVSAPRIARSIHRFSVLIILGWSGDRCCSALLVPPLEVVEREHSVSLSPADAPSFKAMQRMGEVFKESKSGSVAVIVLEGQEPLGDDAHKYYDDSIRQLRDDPRTCSTSRTSGGPAHRGRRAERRRQGRLRPDEPRRDSGPGRRRTSPSRPSRTSWTAHPRRRGSRPTSRARRAIVADMGKSGNRTVLLITAVSIGVIFVMLLCVFRSIVTAVLILLFMVGVQLQVARGSSHSSASRRRRADHLRRQSLGVHRDRGGNGLRHILRRALSGGTSGRRGPGNGLLHHIPQCGQGRAGLRA